LIELSSSPGWSIFTLLPFFSCTLTAHPSCRAKPPPPSFPSLARVVLPFSLFCHLATANSASTSTSTPSSPFPLLRYLVFLHEDKARRYFIRSPLGPSLSSRCRRSFRRTALQGSRRVEAVDAHSLPNKLQSVVDFKLLWRPFTSFTLGCIQHLHLLPRT
jgi:hypothetical protein